ncbi:MAG: ABC transporter ATP-binding protein [Clostridia bacterium]|nr:ABC transporter ATP-binding protein [Clostridia bacterium]
MGITNAIEMKNITKTFGSVIANNKVNLDIRKGEVLSVLGENGCGKTTLMNMLAGIYYPDSGQIFVNGEEVTIKSPKDAYALKIGMVHQHFKLVDVFTAAQNIALGVKDNGHYSIKKIAADVREMASRYGFIIDPNKMIHEMSVSEKQTVEIIKVLYRGANILILDEPTAVLTPQEIKTLFNVLREMKKDGKSIVIITHKLNEVMEISDRVAVLRKGEHIATVETKDTNEKELADMMVGKKLNLNIDRKDPVDPKPRLIIEHMTVKNRDGLKAVDDVSFTINGGEILGIAGIAGNGQKELLEGIAGLQKVESGSIIFHNPKKNKPVTFFHKDLKKIKKMAGEGKFHYPDGTRVDLTGKSNKEIIRLVNEEQILFYEDEIIDLRHRTPREIQELGIKLSFVPEDRLNMGLVGNMSIVDNMALRSYRKGKSIFVNKKRPKNLADTIIHDLEVVTPSDQTPVRRLSGGNVQKVLVGREISSSPKVLMAAYPVRGLDINSSYLIYNLLNQQKERNVAVVYVGEDLDVLLALADRLVVLSGGKVAGIVDARKVTKEEVGLLMLSRASGAEAEAVADMLGQTSESKTPKEGTNTETTEEEGTNND